MADITQIKVGSTTYDIKDAKANIAYGTCTTAADTAAKVVTITNNASWSLTAGSMVTVLFSNTNKASNPTLNVNSTGAKNIYYGTAQITTSNLSYAGYASRLMTFMYDGTQYRFICWGVDNNSNTVPSVQMETAAGTAAKVGTCTNHTLLTKSYVHVNVRYTNTYAGAITLNIDSAGAKPIYLNGSATSSSNYNLAAGTYIAYYDGTNFYFRTDGKLTADITGSAGKVANALTFNNSGSGVASGTTFDGSAARTISYNTIGAAASGHTHTTTLATSSGTNELTLAHGTKYAITAGGDSFVFTMPSDTNTTLSGVGTCTTGASTAAKAVVLPGFALSANQTILIRVSTANSATSGVTLNVNSTGAKSIYIGGSAWSTSNQLTAGDYLATYDGTYWKLTRIYLTNTTYSAGTGISLSGTTFSNSGVRSVGTGSANGTISVNTNGTAADVAVKGLGSAAYTASTAYAGATHNQASNTINAMTGYSKPSTTSAIAATDTLNAAIGKLEKAIDGKTSNTGTITGVTAGNGLTNGGTSGSVTLHVGAGTGITVNADDIAVKYGTEAGTACQGNDSRLSNARTPTSHASTATTYGAGTSSNYGHVKLSDSTSSTSAASAGIAASPKAVKAAYDLAASKASITSTTVTLTASSWTSSNTISASVTGVTASNIVIVSPDPANIAAYTEAGVYCSAQASGSLTFTCTNKPAANLSVNVVIFG